MDYTGFAIINIHVADDVRLHRGPLAEQAVESLRQKELIKCFTRTALALQGSSAPDPINPVEVQSIVLMDVWPNSQIVTPPRTWQPALVPVAASPKHYISPTVVHSSSDSLAIRPQSVLRSITQDTPERPASILKGITHTRSPSPPQIHRKRAKYIPQDMDEDEEDSECASCASSHPGPSPRRLFPLGVPASSDEISTYEPSSSPARPRHRTPSPGLTRSQDKSVLFTEKDVQITLVSTPHEPVMMHNVQKQKGLTDQQTRRINAIGHLFGLPVPHRCSGGAPGEYRGMHTMTMRVMFPPGKFSRVRLSHEMLTHPRPRDRGTDPSICVVSVVGGLADQTSFHAGHEQVFFPEVDADALEIEITIQGGGIKAENSTRARYTGLDVCIMKIELDTQAIDIAGVFLPFPTFRRHLIAQLPSLKGKRRAVLSRGFHAQ